MTLASETLLELLTERKESGMIVETFGIVRYCVQIYQPAVTLLSATSLMEECARGTGMRINFEAYIQQLLVSHEFQVCVIFCLCPVLPTT